MAANAGQQQGRMDPFRVVRLLLTIGGVILAAQIAMAVLGMPRSLTDWLACRAVKSDAPVGCVVVLGGGGIPSQTGLVRTYYGAEAALKHASAKIVVALTSAGDPATNSLGRMRNELVLRGVTPDRILLEPGGRDTAEQAAKIHSLMGKFCGDKAIAIVTSPMHLRRSVLCFRKAGFASVAALAAEDTSTEGDVGDGLSFRYGFWSNWAAQIEAARELVAIAWYRFKGRI